MGFQDLKNIDLKDLLAGVALTLMAYFAVNMISSVNGLANKIDSMQIQFNEMRIKSVEQWTRSDHILFEKEMNSRLRDRDERLNNIELRLQKLESR